MVEIRFFKRKLDFLLIFYININTPKIINIRYKPPNIAPNPHHFALDLKNPANGTINVYNQSSGVIRGNVNVQGTLINQGVVELPYNAANSAIAKIKKFDNYSDGILRVGFDTDGTKDNTSYSKLLSETAIFYDNSAIDVNVLDSSTNVWNLVAGTSVQNNIDNSINLHSNNLNYHLKTVKFL